MLTLLLLAAAPQVDFWKNEKTACPAGSQLVGKAAPREKIGCEKNGVGEGPWAIFDDAGHLSSNGGFRAGKLHGPWAEWFPNGQKRREGVFLDGVADGTFRAWDDKGKAVGSYEMKKGTGRELEWHPNGQKSLEVDSVDGIRVGRATTWDEAGHKTGEGSFAEGHESGTWTYFDTAGVITHVDVLAGYSVLSTVEYQDGKPLQKPPTAGCAKEPELAKLTALRLDGCVRPAPHFPFLTSVGTFANDRGCGPEGVVLDCKYVKKEDGAAVLARAGWKAARAALREKLAIAYVDEVVGAWEQHTESFAERLPDGTIRVSTTLTSGPSMRGTTTSTSVTYEFNAAGGVKRIAP